MPMATEDEIVGRKIVTSREPKAKPKPGQPGSVGDQALMDAVIAIGIAWVLLFLLGFSLRGSNV